MSLESADENVTVLTFSSGECICCNKIRWLHETYTTWGEPDNLGSFLLVLQERTVPYIK